MAFDPVPFVIGGGAEHSDEVFRVMANMATRDAQGIALPGHMKVNALGTPDVRIDPGNCVIRNVQAEGQSYVGRVATTTDVTIAATGGSDRSDLVIARVIDPDFSPWTPYTDPEEIKFGPYFEPHVVTGVDPSTTRADQVVSYSAVALARIDMPASTTNVVAGYITDLRELALPRYWPEYDVQRGPSPSEELLPAETTYHHWPSNSSLAVKVPRWATKAQVSITLEGVRAGVDEVGGRTRCVFGSTNGSEVVIDYNGNPAAEPSDLYERVTHATYAEFDVTSMQDTTQTVKLEAKRTSGSGLYRADFQMFVTYDIRFKETVV